MSAAWLCQLLDWDGERLYDEDPPIYIHYSIEWKVTVNNRAIMPKDTEQDVVLAPAAFWQHLLEPKLNNFLRKKNRPLRSEDTNVVVSVTERSERDLTNRFDDTTIDWAVIEMQLVAWGELYRAGRADKRGSSSTTRRMLAEGSAQLDAEHASSRHPPAWREVYKTMRCAGPPCSKRPYCWCDPIRKKHYKLNTGHLKNLVIYVLDGHTLETHKDVPENIREELYAEEQQSLERHKKASRMSTSSVPPINITNVLPAPSGQTPHLASPAGTPAPTIPLKSTLIDDLNIPGFRNDAIEEYCAWQQSKNRTPALKVEYDKARKLILDVGMDLDLIRDDPDPEFLIKGGVRPGIAKRVVRVRDIDFWVEKVKRARTEE